MSVQARARDLLGEIRQELETLGLWEVAPPSPDELASTAPFAFDTLEFHQWVQWVFVPRTHALLDAGGSLPPDCSIAPMAEWYAAERSLETRLVGLFERFDGLWAQTD